MQRDEIVTRANNIEAAICNRTGLSGEDYLMLFFETGCETAERFYVEGGIEFQGYSAKDFMTSNVFWYWWAQSFMRGCELFLHTTFKRVNILEVFLKKNPWPTKETYEKIIMELNLKKRANEQRTATPNEAARYRTIASSI